MVGWGILVGAVMRKKPINMSNPDPHFVNYLMDHGWDVQKLSGTEKYRAYPPQVFGHEHQGWFDNDAVIQDDVTTEEK